MSNSFLSLEALSKNSLCIGNMGITESFSDCRDMKPEMLITVFKQQYLPLHSADIE